jgi:hypothetical protein
LLFLDPPKLGDRKDADGFHLHPRRGCNAHAATRRMNAQMDILDVLEHHIDRHAANVEFRDHQYSF